MVPIQHIQLPGAFVARLSQGERRALATYLFLRLRFQSLFIHHRLDRRTVRKAGCSQRTLRRYLDAVCEKPGPLLKKLGTKISDSPWHLVKPGDPFEDRARAMGRGWALATPKVFRGRIEHVLAGEPSKARNTVRIHGGMDIHAIRNELNKKHFELLGAQVLYQQEEGSVSDAESINGKDASKVGIPRREYPTHHLLESIADKPRHASMPSKAFAARMGVSTRTFWRLVHQWEASGSIRRIRRRVRLPGPVEDPQAFREKWGMAPFVCGGLWYAQLPNLYQFTENYRGPWAFKRKEEKGYGKTVTQMFQRPRK